MPIHRPTHPILTGRLPAHDEVQVEEPLWFSDGTRTVNEPVKLTPREAGRILYRTARESGRDRRQARIFHDAFLHDFRYVHDLEGEEVDFGAETLEKPTVHVATLREENERLRARLGRR